MLSLKATKQESTEECSNWRSPQASSSSCTWTWQCWQWREEGNRPIHLLCGDCFQRCQHTYSRDGGYKHAPHLQLHIPGTLAPVITSCFAASFFLLLTFGLCFSQEGPGEGDTSLTRSCSGHLRNREKDIVRLALHSGSGHIHCDVLL